MAYTTYKNKNGDLENSLLSLLFYPHYFGLSGNRIPYRIPPNPVSCVFPCLWCVYRMPLFQTHNDFSFVFPTFLKCGAEIRIVQLVHKSPNNWLDI